MTRTAARTVNPALAWAPALIVSALAHTLMVAVLKEAVEPDPIPFIEEIRTRILMSPMKVPTHRAEAQEAESEAAELKETRGECLGVRIVPSSRAHSVAPVGRSLAALAPKSTVAPPTLAAVETLRATQPTGGRLPTAPVAGLRIPPAAVEAQDMAAAPPAPAPVVATAPSETAVSAAAPATEAIASARHRAVALAASDAQGRLLEAAQASAQSMAAATASAEALAPAQGLGTALTTAELPATVITAAPASAETLSAAKSRGPSLATAELSATVVAAVPAPAETLSAAESRGRSLAIAELPLATMAAVAAPAQALTSVAPRSLGVASVRTETERLVSTVSGGRAVAEIPPSAVAGIVAPTHTSVAAVATTAALAWTGETNTALDEKSLAAIQSFMQPHEVVQSPSHAGSVRDGIGESLAQFPCSRLQAAYQPETGGLEIRGHVPVPALREEVVAMLERVVGGAIPIGRSVMVLPAPQCGALNAVEGLGFPQSKDQENDPLEVGREAQAQILSFEEGQQVVFSLQAPEFDAHIYLDYYDKDGNVTHVPHHRRIPGPRGVQPAGN